MKFAEPLTRRTTDHVGLLTRQTIATWDYCQVGLLPLTRQTIATSDYCHWHVGLLQRRRTTSDDFYRITDALDYFRRTNDASDC